MTDDLLNRARRLWTHLAGARGSSEVTVSPGSLLCPPGWVGIVVLGGAVIATAPDEKTADLVRRALADLPVPARIDPVALGGRLPVAEALGPATLAYCDGAGFRPITSGAAESTLADSRSVTLSAAESTPAGFCPATSSTVESVPAGFCPATSSTVESVPAGFCPATSSAVESVPAGERELAALLERVPAGDADESGLAEITSPAFVLRAGPELIAAAGYRTWPGGAAHLSVLTVEAERGRGLARVVAGAAVADALEAGLLPQWRARPEASRRVARALGFRELGAQLSIRLGTPLPDTTGTPLLLTTGTPPPHTARTPPPHTTGTPPTHTTGTPPTHTTGTRLLHITERTIWEDALRTGWYRTSTRGVSLDEQGFIHCSLPHQLRAVAEFVYGDADDLVVLVIDSARLDAPVRFEIPEPGADEFPHIYGAVPTSAVCDVIPVVRDSMGQMLLPE